MIMPEFSEDALRRKSLLVEAGSKDTTDFLCLQGTFSILFVVGA